MSIEIIGAGFGRTGTASLKIALEKLGYDKCYHMSELIQNPEKIGYWETLQKGGEPDWEDLFAGYKATVDFPGCLWYKQMMKKYPDAKVILTVRDPEKWYKSAYDTIYQAGPTGMKIVLQVVALFSKKVNNMLRVFTFAQKTCWKEMFQDRFEDKQYAMDRFNKFNEEVMAYVPKEKLLIMNIQEGWEPLCKFLGKPVPAEAFPRVNDTEEFNNRRKLFKRKKK
jgi:hypothetical protein